MRLRWALMWWWRYPAWRQVHVMRTGSHRQLLLVCDSLIGSVGLN